MGFFESLKAGLGKTRNNFVDKVSAIITGHRPIDDDLFDELEEALIQADVGVNTALNLVSDLRRIAKEQKLEESDQLRQALEDEITKLLTVGDHSLNIEKGRLNIIMVVGVNGVGKTTTIGKLSNRLKNDGYKVLIAAADTFRAAAIDQLQVWCDRAGVDYVAHKEGSDPAAVVFDGIQAAKSRKCDVLLIDTCLLYTSRCV